MEGSSKKKDVSPAPLLWGRPGQASEEHTLQFRRHVLQIPFFFSRKAVGQCDPMNDLIFIFL